MANSNTFEKNLHAIEALYSKLKNGSLSRDEVQDLTQLSRDLYERCVIIQYKVFDGSINQASIASEPVVATVQETPSSFNEIHSPKEVEIAAPILEESNEAMEESPAFDLSLFGEPEDVVDENTIEEFVEDPQTEEFEAAVAEQEVLVDINERIEEQAEELESIVEAPGTDVIETPPAAPTQFTSHSSIVEKLRQLVDPSESQFGMGGITSLVGSFGLNERLLYINELFGGSSEEFANAIQQLDQAGTFDNALAQVNNFAQKFNWNLSSESVSDFVNKLKRRYA